MERLNHTTTDTSELLEFAFTRSRQLLSVGYSLTDISVSSTQYTCISALYSKGNKEYKAIYMLHSHRCGKNFSDWNERFRPDLPTLIVAQPWMVQYLRFNSIDSIAVNGPFTMPEYQAVERYYNNRKPTRANVWLMNHVDEGLAILHAYGADPKASEVFCLHPLIQSDSELLNNRHLLTEFPLFDWAGTFEYRSVANEYLAHRDIESSSSIRLSPLEYVNQAILADKIQNYKDFMLHHNKHINYSRLFTYFHNWFDIFDVSTTFLIDILITLYENDKMNALNKTIQIERISAIIASTKSERARRASLIR